MSEPAIPGTAGAVTGGVRILLRLEGLGLFMLAVLLYGQAGLSWLAFAVFFLTPDLSFLGYLAGPRAGAAIYNLAHDTLGPVLLVIGGFLFAAHPVVLAAALIWLAHIGLDRALGYGLKYSAGFKFTHLGRIGRAAND
ncbi:MAG: DUF4260 domain-containing protein [Pseudomonadota bacterium]